MDLIPILFLLVMVLVGGAVAYAGDVIGRKIGKSRLKWGRMRPKHTAALGTFLAGMLATLITIGAIAAFVTPIRELLFQRRQIMQDLGKSRAELNRTKQDLETQRSKANSLETEVTKTQASLETERTKLDQTSQNANAAERRAREFQAKTQRLVGQTKQLQGKIGPLTGRVKQLSTEATQLGSEVMALSDAQRRISGDNGELQRRNDELTRRNLELDREISSGRANIVTLQREINELKQAQASQSETFNQRQIENQRALEQAERTLKQAEQDLEGLEAEKGRLQRLLEESGAAFRTAPLIYNREDELARVSIPANLTAAEARQQIMGVLTRASVEARQRGATATALAGEAQLVPFTLRGQVISVQEQMDRAVRELAGKNRPQLIRAIAPFNSFRGEFVPVLLDIRPNPVVYAANERIIEMPIDGRLTEDQIAGQIIEFVGTKLREKAIRDGLLPAKGRETPLGELTRDKLLEIINEVKTYGRTARLIFIASQETRAGDVLRLNYRLRP